MYFDSIQDEDFGGYSRMGGVKKPLCITANILVSENISLKLFMEPLETIEL